MRFRGGEFSTGEMGNFHPALTLAQFGSVALNRVVPMLGKQVRLTSGVLDSLRPRVPPCGCIFLFRS